jgi:lipoate-protein ligase B
LSKAKPLGLGQTDELRLSLGQTYMQIIDLGVTDFLNAHSAQLSFVKRVAEGVCENTLLVTEHNPVITIGRRGSWNNILKSHEFLSSRSIDVVTTDRGGDVTYHGPGQLVSYPIFRLENESRDIHIFLQFLEEIGNYFLMQYGLSAEKRHSFRGIWIGGKKIGSIGIAVKKWVTYHGLAINVNTDLMPFSFIRPCGIEAVEMTSLKEIFGCEMDINDAKNRLISSFKEVSLLAEAANKA